MFRKVSPGLVMKLIPWRCNSSPIHGFARNYCRSGKERLVPVYRPRSLFDDFPRTHWPGRYIDEQFREMGKMMDAMTSRFFGRGWPQYRFVESARKEVEVKYTDKMFEVKIDVADFTPEQIQVKLTGDRLVLHAKHELKQEEHGHVTREFTRELSIPEDVELESIESIWTEEGQLIIRGKVKGAGETPERTINIQRESKK